MLSLFQRYKPLYLFCPGPVHVAKNVKDASVGVEIGHREPEFSELFDSINKNLLNVLEIRRKSKFFTVVITGSSSASNESVLTSATQNKKLLLISNGEFGERLIKIANINKLKYSEIHFPWGEKFSINKIESKIKEKKINAIAMVHHETSTGMLNDVNQIGKLAKKYKLLFILDVVSSVGAEVIDLEKWNVSFAIGSSGKALGGFPGLSFVVGKVDEFEKLKNVQNTSLYLNLYNHYVFAKTLKQTPNTPAVPSFLALDMALENILNEGIENNRKKLIHYSHYLRSEFKKLNLTFLLDEADMSSVLTTIYTPPHLTVKEIQTELRKKRIVIYSGKGPIKETAFQVANIGNLTERDLHYFISCFQQVITSQ